MIINREFTKLLFLHIKYIVVSSIFGAIEAVLVVALQMVLRV